jgi:hypothetical protein
MTASLGWFAQVQTWHDGGMFVGMHYGLIVPESLHMSGFLEQMLPGFEWLTPLGFLVGLVEAFLYGAYAGLVFTPLYNGFHKRWVAG